MKRNFIQTMAVIMLVSNMAFADDAAVDQKAEAQVQQELHLAKINALLRELAKANAIEVDGQGKIVVKQSIREQLLERQRLNSVSSVRGGLCE
jgi:hypothetical protein